MTAVIDTSAPIVVIGGRRTYSELTEYGYALADRIDVWLDEHPGLHTPSRVARAVRVPTYEAAAVLSWMDDRVLLAADGNGTWRRYGSRNQRN